jgi:glucose/arabinose dehydrogenase
LDAGEHVSNLTANTSGHWTRDLALSLDGRHLFVSVGSASNVSVESPPRATVQQMNLDGTGRKTWASGLRNPVGLAVHPVTGAVFTVVNERDGLGDDLVPDYMAELEAGDFYGWPYAYLAPDRLDPRRMNGGSSEAPALAAATKTPAVLFQAHSAPLGLAFYDGNTFPERYRNGAFVAFHGSWNRSQATGYKVVFAPFGADGKPTGSYEDFLTGFLVSETSPRAWGRPVDVLVLPDGSLLVSEDANGMIYRIQYHP